jgi:hypothetical protein
MESVSGNEVEVGSCLIVVPDAIRVSAVSFLAIRWRYRGFAWLRPYLHLLAAVDKALLHRRDAFLLLDLFLDLGDLRKRVLRLAEGPYRKRGWSGA